MKSAKRSILGIGLMFTAVTLLSISMSAQQEVSPDHFDDNPVVSKKAKSAPKPAKQVAVKTPTVASRVANKPK
ncbi:MAG: hypothetical protein JWN42_1479, partial [Candidatus Angelobacter sp.]|nr:hypothetical protein [Candidatus Angelobacter sp.]